MRGATLKRKNEPPKTASRNVGTCKFSFLMVEMLTIATVHLSNMLFVSVALIELQWVKAAACFARKETGSSL